jgi:hypothetical protein
MYFPGYTYSELASGLIMMLAAPYVIYKAYLGSKSVFAYVLMAFTLIEGISNFASFFISAFRHPMYANGKIHHFYNMYAW